LRWNALKGAIIRRFIFDSIKFLKIARRVYELYESSGCRDGRHVFLLEAVSKYCAKVWSPQCYFSFPAISKIYAVGSFPPQPNKTVIVFILRSIHHLVNSSRNSAIAAILVILMIIQLIKLSIWTLSLVLFLFTTTFH
jgi:hypothetical protein